MLESQTSKMGLERTKLITEFNYSSTQDAGTLIIRAMPPMQGSQLKQYSIKIDEHDEIIVDRNSETNFILDKGEHQLDIYAFPPKSLKKLYGESFGRHNVRQIFIEKEDTKKLVYTGPNAIFSKGRLEDKNVEQEIKNDQQEEK